MNGLQGELDNRALIEHTHDIDNVNGLQGELDDRALIKHTHDIDNVNGLQGELDNRALIEHNHDASNINDGTLAIARIPTGTTATTVAIGNHVHTAAQVGAAPATHNHNATDINAGIFAIARIPTGTTNATVSLGNHTHTAAQIGLATYPIGAVYTSWVNTSPASLFGGTWTAIPANLFLRSITAGTAGGTGGHAEIQAHGHTTTQNGAGHWQMNIFRGNNGEFSNVSGGYSHRQGSLGNHGGAGSTQRLGAGGFNAPNHGHTVNNTGAGNAGNIPPFMTVFIWRRTA